MNSIALERFYERHEPEPMSGCWIWTGLRHKQGYGRLYVRGMQLAHRLAYEHFVGAIPDDKEIDHTCRNTSCVNPAHLEPVPHHTNLMRGESFSAVNAKKTHCRQGHAYDLFYSNGKRWCSVCKREWYTRYQSAEAYREYQRAYQRARRAKMASAS